MHVVYSAATRTLLLGGQSLFLGVGGQNFWVGLLFSEFSADLKKKGHRTDLVCVCTSSMLISEKKRSVLVVMLGILGGQNFCRPFLPTPIVVALVVLNAVVSVRNTFVLHVQQL